MTRRTIASPATITGTGLFTGEPSSATIEPAAPGMGIRFLHSHTPIQAVAGLLAPSPIPAFEHLPPRHTCLALGTARAITTEHIMSALTGLAITDALIALGDSGEIPIVDGSAMPFASAILKAGLTDLEGDPHTITLDAPISVRQGEATITAEPADRLHYEYRYIPAPGAPLPTQSATWTGDPEDFIESVAPARTFSFKHEAEQMQKLGLFTAFTPRDLLVLDENAHPIDNALRFDNEPARHKLLDLIGDLALAGRPIRAKITATASGHALNHELARRLFEQLAN